METDELEKKIEEGLKYAELKMLIEKAKNHEKMIYCDEQGHIYETLAEDVLKERLAKSF